MEFLQLGANLFITSAVQAQHSVQGIRILLHVDDFHTILAGGVLNKDPLVVILSILRDDIDDVSNKYCLTYNLL